MTADNSDNAWALSYFCTPMGEPAPVSLEIVMNDNHWFNLKLEQFAILSKRSLSGFKRDFQKLFGVSPGKWLMEKNWSRPVFF